MEPLRPLGTLQALQHTKSMEQVLVGSRGTAVAPQEAQRVGDARLASFPHCEQQLLTAPTQHQLSLVPNAADLPRGRSQGQGTEDHSGPAPSPGPPGRRTSGQETESLLIWVSVAAQCSPRVGNPGFYCTERETEAQARLSCPQSLSETPPPTLNPVASPTPSTSFLKCHRVTKTVLCT